MVKKYILLILLILSFIFISSVSAADINNDATIDEVLNVPEDATEINTDKTDVEIITAETIGIYGNKDTELTVYVKDKEGNNVTGGSLTFVDVFGKNYTVNVEDGVASSDVFVGETGQFNIACNYSAFLLKLSFNSLEWVLAFFKLACGHLK